MNGRLTREDMENVACVFSKPGWDAPQVHAWKFTNGAWGYKARQYRHPRRSKDDRRMFWIHRDDEGRWRKGKGPAVDGAKRLPYMADLNFPSVRDVLHWVEGERCSEALMWLGVPATTAGGSSDASGIDYSPIPPGWKHRLWPDNDDAGQRHMQEVATHLRAGGHVVEFINTAALGLPDKGDCVDWIDQHPGATADDVLALPLVPAHEASEPTKVHTDVDDTCVVLVDGATLDPKPVAWLWPGYLARGKLALLCGAAGTGKTTLALQIAATVTSGGRWPDGQLADPGRVVIWSGEDDMADTLVPRLLAAGADMSRVLFVAGMMEDGIKVTFDPARDVPALATSLATVDDVHLMMVDPIVSAIAGDSHKNAEVRRGLQPLVDLGMRCGSAILGISHFSKGTNGRDPVERVTGSLAFGAQARLVLVTAHHRPTDDDPAECRLMLRAKSNIGPDGSGFEYRLEQRDVPGHPGIQASVACWVKPVEGYARDLIAQAETPDVPKEGAVADAMDFLHAQLSHGPKLVTELQTEARPAGVAWRTVQRAKAESRGRIKSRKLPEGGKWEWYKVALVAATAKVVTFPTHIIEERQAPAVTDIGGVAENESAQGFAGQGRQDRHTAKVQCESEPTPPGGQHRQHLQPDGVGGVGGLGGVTPEHVADDPSEWGEDVL